MSKAEETQKKPEDGKYIIQHAHRAHCPLCNLTVELLCSEWCLIADSPMFYVCWPCKKIFQVGVGEVKQK